MVAREGVRIRVLVTAAIVAVFLIPWGVAQGTCTTSWVAPSDDDTHAGFSWDNGYGGRIAYDGEWASATTNGEEHEYDAYGFVLGGDIPATAVITGFEVRIRGYSEGSTGSVSVSLS